MVTKWLHAYHFVLLSHNPPCTPASHLPWGKTRPQWPAAGCTWCRQSSAGDTQSPVPSVQPVLEGSPVGMMHILFQNACRKTQRGELPLEKCIQSSSRLHWHLVEIVRPTEIKILHIRQTEMMHRVCIDRSSSCGGGKISPGMFFC